MVRYYKLFDMLNRRGMKKSDLREILSPKTVAKLSKGEYLSGEVIEKICLFLGCQPGDIMEIVESEELPDGTLLTTKEVLLFKDPTATATETMIEKKPTEIDIKQADELNITKRQIIDRSDW